MPTAVKSAPGTKQKPGGPTPLETRHGPRLSDGTFLRELIDFNKREVAMRILSDPEIYKLELKRIFARSWVGVGHVGEIPNPGDYVKRMIGEDAVIVARGRGGEVSVLLNVCSHRGMEICWSEQGNQASFKCPYHGWVFDSAGNLLGAPFEKEMYGSWDKSQYGLRKARVGIHRGRIFGNFDDSAISLDEWLGEAAYYIDMPYVEGDGEMEVFLSPRRFRVHANWKISADNNAGDTYHGASLHRSLAEMGMAPADDARNLDTLKVSSAMGHGLVGFPRNIMSGGESDPDNPYRPEDRIFTCVMFPATFGIGGSANMRMHGPDGRSYLIVDIGGLNPCGPDAFEFWAARLIEKGAPDEFKAQLRAMASLLDLGGVDDMSAWPSVQRASKGAIGQEQPLRYDATAGENKPAGWTAPGLIYAGVSKDDSQWNFWRRWFELMTADEA